MIKIEETKRNKRFSYREIKELKNTFGGKVKDYIVESPQNDPYYAGSPAKERSAKWIAPIVKEFLDTRHIPRIHDRAIHYCILSKKH